MNSSDFTPEQLKRFQESWNKLCKKIEVSDVAGPIKVGAPREEDTVRYKPAMWPADPQTVDERLEKYRKLVLGLGAVDAKIIAAKDVPQDLRALYVGCLYPTCRWLNTNYQCPMKRTYPFEEMKEFVKDYNYALVFKVLPPSFDSVPDVGKIVLDTYYTMGGGEPPDKDILARNIIRLRILSEMERRIRAAAYYDGYLTAAPVGSGPCIVAKCSSFGKCSALKPEGLCKFMDVQPNGAVAYIDYFKLARGLDWGDLQPGGNCAFPENVPNPEKYFNMGLVLID